MEKQPGFLVLMIVTIFVIGMYIGVGISTGTWLPNYWLLVVITALVALWIGYWFGRGDNKSQ